ncbi:MAG: PEGA domain-containing protein, partial [Myxococcaceae bacterium]
PLAAADGEPPVEPPATPEIAAELDEAAPEIEAAPKPPAVKPRVRKAAPAASSPSPEPSPVAEPVDPSLLGSVQVTSTPEAVVRVKGRVLGKTPVRFDLPAGMHRLEIEYPGAARRTLLVNVVAGKTTPVSETLKR